MNETPPDRYFDAAGVALRYVEAGSGEPVVLLHSFCGNLDRDFVECGLFAALAEHHRAVALDLRGHGKSGKPHERRQYGREMALYVARLLDHLELPRAHIVGSSLGGHIVAQFLSLHPERIITATLGGSPGRRRWTDDEERRAADEAREMARGELRSQLLRLQPPSAPPLCEDEIRERTARILNGNDPKALAAVRLANGDQRVSDAELCSAGVPTLGLVGTRDPYVDDFRELAQCMPKLRLVEIEGATHEDAPARREFRDALLAFLRSHCHAD